MAVELSDADDAKLVTLARSSRVRAGAIEGAAVRDADGRTYAAVSVDLPSLSLTALQSAVAMAIASGVSGLEAAVIVTDGLAVSEADRDVVRDLAGPGVPIYRADSTGVVIDSVTT
jgi:hypothetical protein